MDTIIIFAAKYLYLLVLLIAVIYFFTQSKKIQKSMALCSLVIAPVAYIISRIAGHFYYNPRPFVVGNFVPLISHAADNGFPSDHVLLTGAIAMIMFFYNRKLSAMLWVLAILIGLARVASGIHHMTDIVGSIAIALISGAIYYFIVRRARK